MAFLDETGLKYFWSKIKQKFFPINGGTVSGNMTVTGSVTAKDVKASNSSIDHNFAFTPEFGKGNRVTNCLLVSTTGDFSGITMQSGWVGTENAASGDLVNCPVSSGQFYALRHVYVDGKNRVLVELIETLPSPGRAWYNKFSGDWTGWKCVNKADEYIVAKGTSGVWTYRKWNSGVAECWGKIDCPRMAAYVCYKQQALPFNMNITAITTGLADYNFDGQATWDFNVRGAAMGNNSVLAAVFSPGKGISASNVFHVYVHVIGRAI